ncbi:MAG: AraC family transcriptional regulator [Candidatus Acidiferrales bacterium]
MASSQRVPLLRRLRRSEHLHGLVLSEIDYPPRFRIGWHRHELAALALTVRGSLTETFANSGIKLMECGLLIRPAGERHWDSVGDLGATCFLIEVRREWLDDVPRLATILTTPSFHERGPIRLLARRAYHEWLLGDTASPIAIQALVMEIVAHLVRDGEARARGWSPLWLKRVKQRLDEGFAETLSLAELARIGGVHPTHLARQFRRHYRLTIGEYIRERRVDAAIGLLAEKDLSLTEIALDTGFSSHGHLCTVLKQATGMTPTQFRQINGRKSSR